MPSYLVIKIQIDLKPWDYKAMKYTVFGSAVAQSG